MIKQSALVVVISLALAGAGLSGSSLAQSANESFLFASPSDPTKPAGRLKPEGCSTDPLSVAKLAQVASALQQLALPAGAVEFRGCTKTEFQTSALPSLGDDDFAAAIYYPLSSDLKPGDYVSPIIHELGHVFQLRKAGSMVKLRNEMESRQIELGADFISGLLLSRAGGMTPSQFQANAALVGKYRETSDEHGSPVQRASAFRYGAFHDRNYKKADVATANERFQRDDYERLIYDTTKR